VTATTTRAAAASGFRAGGEGRHRHHYDYQGAEHRRPRLVGWRSARRRLHRPTHRRDSPHWRSYPDHRNPNKRCLRLEGQSGKPPPIVRVRASSPSSPLPAATREQAQTLTPRSPAVQRPIRELFCPDDGRALTV
jgi:ribosome modulation factor